MHVHACCCTGIANFEGQAALTLLKHELLKVVNEARSDECAHVAHTFKVCGRDNGVQAFDGCLLQAIRVKEVRNACNFIRGN